VPGAALDRDELDQLAVAADEEVRGNPHPMDFSEVWVRVWVQPVGEQALDGIAAVLAGRQADRVQDYKGDFATRRALVLIGRINDSHR
jgi:hypothetical protein